MGSLVSLAVENSVLMSALIVKTVARSDTQVTVQHFGAGGDKDNPDGRSLARVTTLLARTDRNLLENR